MSAPKRLAASCVGEVDDHDVCGAEELRGHHRGEPDGTGADDGDDVTGGDLAVEHSDLVAGREDVRDHQQVLVADAGGDGIGRVVGERDAHELCLGAVDEVPEDPSTTTEALAGAAFATEAAGGADRHARDQHAVAGVDVLHACSDRLDGADGLVAENPAVGDGRDVSLHDVQIGPADGRPRDLHDRVRGVFDAGLRLVLPGSLPRTVIDECFHGLIPLSVSAGMRACQCC